MKARILPIDIVRRVRASGIDIPANAGGDLRRDMEIGRRLRTPNIGWVLDEKEAKIFEAALVNHYQERKA